MGALAIWMNGEWVGTWSVGRTGAHRLDYAPSWRVSARSRPLSLSLPFTADNRLEGDAVRNYFDNLLPDSDGIRKRISAHFRTKGTDAFALLQAVGRDCVGAVQLLPPGESPEGFDQLKYEPLTPTQIENHLAALGSQTGLGAQDEEEAFRLSIAGAQEKTALLQVNGQWCRPLGATPTTHILKPPIGITPGRNLDLRLSVENEGCATKFCMPWVCPRHSARYRTLARAGRWWSPVLTEAGRTRAGLPDCRKKTFARPKASQATKNTSSGVALA